ncbi:MAG: hypothetical protein KAR47_00115, partial [Planctomycetes bacterium]|nr:hypothetical protein [Planctomycetota bacterium]
HDVIGYATVARTLKLLTQADLCREVDFGEIFSPQLEKIQNQFVKKHGFVAKSHQLNIFGTCPKCQKKQIEPITPKQTRNKQKGNKTPNKYTTPNE